MTTVMTSSATVEELLLAFVTDHPEGWNHADWLDLLGALGAHGADVSDPEELGIQLEQRRLEHVLETRKIKGLGPRRIDAIVERFGTLWNASHASAADFADIPTIPTKLAEDLAKTLSA